MEKLPFSLLVTTLSVSFWLLSADNVASLSDLAHLSVVLWCFILVVFRPKHLTDVSLRPQSRGPTCGKGVKCHL